MKMLKYQNQGFTIRVKLEGTDYSIRMIALFSNEENTCICKQEIARNDIGDFKALNDGDVKIQSDKQYIKVKMAEYVTKKFATDGYKKEIEMYEFENKCLCYGIEHFENESEEK